MKEPTRMCESDELPQALREAFGTLARDAPSAETVLRVQRSLSALPATAPAATAAATLGLGKLLVLATLIAGALMTAVVLKGRLQTPEVAEPATVASQAPAAQPLLPRETSEAATTGQSAALAAANEPPEPAVLADHGTPREEASPRHAPSVERSGVGREQQATQLATRRHVLLARATARFDESSAAAPAPNAPEAPALPEAAPSGLAHAQSDEAQRLAQCKRLALREPEEALRQVEALAREMPSGALVQERELLTIRLHERLGQRATAEQLAQRFLERYPNSVYRRALLP